MEFDKATELKEKNNHLIGKKDSGATIDELILVPTNADLAEECFKIYLQTLDGEQAILPFAGEDVDIVAVFDKKLIHNRGVFFKTDIFNLPDDLEVITE